MKKKAKTGRLSKNTLIALAFLAAALLGTLYFFLVDRPVREGIREADRERSGIENRLNVLKTRAENVSGVSEEVDSLTANGQLSWMPSYNSEEAELEMLHSLLDNSTSNYQISFSNVTRNENQIRRACSLSFTANSYETAKQIIYRLTHGQYRCLIFNMSLSGVMTEDPGVSVSLSATFYETMAGGQPDMGLPAGNRGEAVDPMGEGLPFSSIMPKGVAEGVERTRDYLSAGPSFSNIDDIMAQAGE